MALTQEDLQAIATLLDQKLASAVSKKDITESESNMLDEIQRMHDLNGEKINDIIKRQESLQSDISQIKTNNDVVNTLLKLINNLEQRITDLEKRIA